MEHKTRTKALSWLLSLAMVLSLLPGMSLTAWADEPTETLLTTITPTGTTTYSESKAGVVNVTLSGIRSYYSGKWENGGTVTVTPVMGYTITKCRFNARKGAVDDTEAPFSINVGDATYVGAVEVYGYATGPDKSALNDAITAAETLYNSIKDVADYSTIANTLKAAIDAAKEVARSDTADQDAIDAATEAITNAKTPAEAALAAAQAKADGVDYIITIPAKLSVKSDGWNPTDGVTAKLGSGDAFNSGKKLTVTATSTNSWALKSGDNTVGYNLATATGTYSSGATPASWEFSADEITTAGTTKPMGIIVDDFSAMPAGKYTDTVTFTASVEDARQLHSFTLIGPYTGDTLVVEFYEGQTWSDMAAKYSKLRIIRDWIGFGSDGMIYKNGRDWVLTTDTVDPNATYTIE